MWRECVSGIFPGIREGLFGEINQEVAKRYPSLSTGRVLGIYINGGLNGIFEGL